LPCTYHDARAGGAAHGAAGSGFFCGRDSVMTNIDMRTTSSSSRFITLRVMSTLKIVVITLRVMTHSFGKRETFTSGNNVRTKSAAASVFGSTLRRLLTSRETYSL